jgi:hypothetical protein
MKHQFEPHKLKKKQIQAIHNHVIVSDMAFDERLSRGGIWLANDNGTGNGIRPRWGRVYTVGPEQKEIQAGQWVLVAHGRWTRGLDIEDESGKRTIRKIDPNDILMVSDSEECPQIEGVSTAVHVSKLAM